MNEFFFSKNTLTFAFDLFFKYLPLRLLSMLLPSRQQWIITERETDARDNGWVLYKWIRENHPEIEVIYAIKKSAPDYDNVKTLGKVVEFGSWAHWYYYMTSTICMSTQWHIGIPNSICFILMRNYLPPKGKRVFLQHGITKDYILGARQNKLRADLFVCGAYPEWEYISSEFGYRNNEVQYLGFCRFDRLISTSSRRQILFMPTWRAGQHIELEFEKSDYFIKIGLLLSNQKLNRYLQETNTELVFFIHPSIRDKKKYFARFANSNIRVMNNEDYDLQKLICSANLLLTDYSSIYFDFAYQGKPVVYYQYDYEEYRRGHYAEGYFSYENDGFGPICKDEQTLVHTLISIAETDWKLEEKYAKRAERFFPCRDSNNCQRHYEALCKLDGFEG